MCPGAGVGLQLQPAERPVPVDPVAQPGVGRTRSMTSTVRPAVTSSRTRTAASALPDRPGGHCGVDQHAQVVPARPGGPPSPGRGRQRRPAGRLRGAATGIGRRQVRPGQTGGVAAQQGPAVRYAQVGDRQVRGTRGPAHPAGAPQVRVRAHRRGQRHRGTAVGAEPGRQPVQPTPLGVGQRAGQTGAAAECVHRPSVGRSARLKIIVTGPTPGSRVTSLCSRAS